MKCCADQIGARKNSMELFGYDFLVDEKYTPWLIEINSSPSMEHSTSITGRMVPDVLEDTLKVVIDYSFAKKGTKKKVDTGGFELIYKGDTSKTNFALLNSKVL
jgi:tubulin monoglycylase TTLL3/8